MRDEPNFLREILVTIGGLILVLTTIFVFSYHYRLEGERTKRARIAACQTIKQEDLRMACIQPDAGYDYYNNRR